MKHTRTQLAQQSADAMNYSGKALHAIVRTVFLVIAFLFQSIAAGVLWIDNYLNTTRKREEQLAITQEKVA